MPECYSECCQGLVKSVIHLCLKSRVGGRFMREGTCVHLGLIHVDV